jgi:hypothetical protein
LNPPNKNRGNQNNQPVLDVMILVESIWFQNLITIDPIGRIQHWKPYADPNNL